MRSRRLLPILLALAAAGCGATSVPPSVAPDPLIVSDRAGTAVLEVRLEAGVVASGDALEGSVVIRNGGPRPLFWHGNDCQLVSAMTVAGPPLAAAEPGRAWAGFAGEIKRLTMTPVEVAGIVSPDTLARGELGQGCDAVGVVSEVPPGGQFETPIVWPAVTRHGIGLQPGGYRLSAAVDLAAGPDAAALPAAAPLLGVTVDLAVHGDAYDGLDAPEVMDALLANADVWRVLDTIGPNRWGGADLRFRDGRWHFRFDYDLDAGRVEVQVDPGSGAILGMSVRGQP